AHSRPHTNTHKTKTPARTYSFSLLLRCGTVHSLFSCDVELRCGTITFPLTVLCPNGGALTTEYWWQSVEPYRQASLFRAPGGIDRPRPRVWSIGVQRHSAVATVVCRSSSDC